jgi:hypothetical protein
MRVMVVVMVPTQHEGLAYERRNTSSIAKIRLRESGFVIAKDSSTQQSALGLRARDRDDLPPGCFKTNTFGAIRAEG